MVGKKDRMKWEIEKALAEQEYIDKKKFLSWVRWSFGCSTEKAKSVISDLENLNYIKSLADMWISNKYEGKKTSEKLNSDIIKMEAKEGEDGKTEKIQ